MTFLPIVERELRVAAWRRGTYWLRFFAALAVITIALCLLLTAPSSAPAFRIGKVMFGFQSALAFGFCLLAGVFLTADTLSAEKREGTIGLLFLTDLKGVEVVLGKLVASSMQSVYALLAVLPILGLPLLMGGVTPGEFWRMNLALVTTLMFSLVVGMVASSLGRESRETMVMSLVVIVAVAGVLPALGWLEQVTIGRTVVQEYWLLPSPVGAMTGAFDATYRTSKGWTFWALGPDPLTFGRGDGAIFGRIFFGGGVLLFVDEC
jgi:ABC-type transport system involved in multi-copper enzyme maturation permease subunit